jgi:hypothetical protein
MVSVKFSAVRLLLRMTTRFARPTIAHTVVMY